jgi:hypothetical protein
MKKYLRILPFVAMVFGLSSCLKDKALIATDKSNIVEFYTTEAIASAPTELYAVYVKSYVAGEPKTFDVTVSYSGSDVAPQDISVDVAIDEAALAKYNVKAAANGSTEYTMLPASAFTLPANTTVVIKKGERRATFSVAVKIPADFDFNADFALPLTIKSASFGTVSGNFGTVLYKVGAKNIYDGVYSLTGTVLREGDPVLSGSVPEGATMELTTLTSTSVGFVPVWADGNAAGGVAGSTITINPTTNKVTVTSTTNPAVQNLPSFDNRYDPATKTFYISFFWGTGPTNRAATYTLKYSGPRD